MPLDPKLKLIPLTYDTVEDYARLRVVGFKETLNKIFFSPGGPSPDTIAGMKAYYKTFVDDGCHCFVIQDTTTTAIIAAAKWRLVGHKQPDDTVLPITPAEVDKELATPPKWLECPQDTWDRFYAILNGTTREIMGTRPYWILDLLVTDPEHERRGAGSELAKWGCEQADRLGVEAYIEASMTGTPMYARLGFEIVRTVTFDPIKEVGRDVGYAYTFNAMIRKPRNKERG